MQSLYTSSEILLLILKVVEVMDISFCLLINTLKTEQNPDKMLLGAEAIIFEEEVHDIFWNRTYLAIFLFLFLMHQTHENKDLFTNLSEQIAPKTKGNCLMIVSVVATKI